MNSKMVFGQYFYGKSWLHKLDPRVKLISVLIIMISLFLINNLYVLGGFFLFLILLILSTRIPFIKFLNSIRMMSLVLILTFILQIVFRKEGEVLNTFNFTLTYFNLSIIVFIVIFWYITKKYLNGFKTLYFLLVLLGAFLLQYYFKSGKVITEYRIVIYDKGLQMSSYIIIRIISLLFVSSLLTFSTKPTELNNGLEYLLKPLKVLKIKTSVLTMMISIALRFIPTLILEADKILKAQASRGADFKEGKLKNRIMQVVSLIVPMFVIAYKRAIDLADAMEARGYIPEGKRSSIYELKYKTRDYFVYIFDIFLLVLVIIGRVMYAL